MPPDRAWRDEATLYDIYDAACRIRAYIQELDRAAFEADDLRVLAVERLLEIIGEATKRLSHGFRSAHPQIAWSKMAGMRDRVVHGYDEIDLHEVWRTATEDVPDLIRDLEPLIAR